MKIISNEKYRKIIAENKTLNEQLEHDKTDYMLKIKELELKIDEVKNQLLNIISKQNKDMGKEKYREKVKDVIIFIDNN